jgi:hypothetical protein
MIHRPSRRSIFRSTAAIATVAFSTKRLGKAQDRAPFKRDYRFIATPNLLTQIDESNKVLAANAWVLPSSDEQMVPYVTDSLPVPLVSDGPTVCELCTSADAAGERLPISQQFLDFRLFGELPTHDVINDIVRVRSENLPFDVSLNLTDALTAQLQSSPYLAAVGVQPVPRTLNPDSIFKAYTAFGYRFQFRGPDQGGLDCAPEAPQHYNAELFKQNPYNPNRWDYKINLHIAVWKQSSGKYCIAVANNEGWPKCIRLCNPTWTDIYNVLLTALLYIGVSYLIAQILASGLATIIFGSLAVL